uniref:Cilia- and flagella-associated protein 53 n=1 Tax=Otolemur garnettii TaxID=30611 RepID=H0WNG1_OTOGA
MYSQRFGTVQREVKGPTPNVVIVRAKPPKEQKVEQHLERIRRSHQKYHAILASIKSNERDRLKVEWNQHNDRKFLENLVQARIKDAVQGFIVNVEERRNKLRELLASEENVYFTEMQLKEETIEEKKDRMKEKTRVLKEKKEKERLDFVAEKLDQQFREGCEELRAELCCLHQKKVCEERKAQIAFNEELKRQKLLEKEMFARLWEEDRLAKEKREAQEMRRQKELVENTRLGLNAQITSMQAQRQAAQLLKEEEARHVESDIALVKLEDEQDKLKKQKTKQEIRTLLQNSLQEKIKQTQQEYREEQDLNMKLVQRALQDLQEEADKKKQKRVLLLRHQVFIYTFLKMRDVRTLVIWYKKRFAMKNDEEKICLHKQHILRMSPIHISIELTTSTLLILDPVQRKAKEQEELAMEKERINEGLKELNCEEKENFARRQALAQEYRKQLQEQIAYREKAREAEEAEKRREYEAGVEANKVCLNKIQEILSAQVLPQYVHPMRKACPSKLPP